MRKLGREGGFTYKDFHNYAKDYRIQQIMDSFLKQQDPSAVLWPTDVNHYVSTCAMLQPHVNLNTGMMWLYASNE